MFPYGFVVVGEWMRKGVLAFTDILVSTKANGERVTLASEDTIHNTMIKTYYIFAVSSMYSYWLVA